MVTLICTKAKEYQQQLGFEMVDESWGVIAINTTKVLDSDFVKFQKLQLQYVLSNDLDHGE